MKKTVVLLLSSLTIINSDEVTATISDFEASYSFNKSIQDSCVDILLVSRNVSTSAYSALQADEIALIFACLAVSIHNDKQIEIRDKLNSVIDGFSYNKDIENITYYLNTPATVATIKNARKTNMLAIFDNYCAQLSFPKFKPSGWKIIVFNEMFFSKSTPLKSAEVESIKEIFFKFLNSSNILLHANFLYEGKAILSRGQVNRMRGAFDGTQVLPSNYPKALFCILNSSGTFDFSKNKTLADEYRQYLDNLDLSIKQNVLFNRSYIFFMGNTIARYNKSTYCFESDNLLISNTNTVKQNAYVYNIGDGKDHEISEQYKLFSKSVIHTISSEICYDLTLGIRKENGWKNDEKESKLHIYTSNTSLQNKSPNFPTNKVVACVDPDGTTSLKNTVDHALTLVFKQKHIYPDPDKYIYQDTSNRVSCGSNTYTFTSVKNVSLN